jgi:hypothetical protein
VQYKPAAAVLGDSKLAIGVHGNSERFGVWGQVGYPNALPSETFFAGVVGNGAEGAGGTKALGVVGTSTSRAGVYGQSGEAPTANPIEPAGVIGNAKDTVGVLGFSDNIGVLGIVGTENNIFEPAGVVGSSQNAVGVIGTSKETNGVYGQCGPLPAAFEVGPAGLFGTSQGGRGVIGVSDLQPGVYGVRVASSGKKQTGAVVGDSTTADGVVGLSTSAVGVRGVGRRGGVFQGSAAQVNLAPSGAATHPDSGTAGDLFVDNSKRLWFCKGGASWLRIV